MYVCSQMSKVTLDTLEGSLSLLFKSLKNFLPFIRLLLYPFSIKICVGYIYLEDYCVYIGESYLCADVSTSFALFYHFCTCRPDEYENPFSRTPHQQCLVWWVTKTIYTPHNECINRIRYQIYYIICYADVKVTQDGRKNGETWMSKTS